MADANLRGIFRANLPDVHWQPVETAITGKGVPDMNGCVGGVEFWVENKWARSFPRGLEIDKFQVAWHERRHRCGGRTFLAVRLLTEAGPRKGAARDELYLYGGSAIRDVFLYGLTVQPLLHCKGAAPARWDWVAVRRIFTGAIAAAPIQNALKSPQRAIK